MARKKDSAPALGEEELVDDNETGETIGAAEDADSAEEEPAEIAGETEVSAAPSTESAVLGNVHSRVTKAAEGATTGPQEAHFALHTVELLTGRLKTALPAAIEAASDYDLKNSLLALQNLL